MGDSSNTDEEEGQKQLPDDLVAQHILPCLPIKPLTQYKVISKQVSSSLSSPNFILKHTKQPLFSHPGPPVEQLFIQFNHHYFLYSCVNDDNVADYNNNYIQVNNLVELDVEFAIDEGEKIELVGSSNGLVCLAENYGKYFFLYNPVTNQSHKYYPGDFELINYTRPCVHWGFGHVSSVNDYKVVRIMMYWGNVFSTIHVFSLNSNCWRKIEFDLVDGLLFGRGKLVNETLYWVKLCYNGKNKTLAFDLASETLNWCPHLMTKTIEDDVLCVMGGCLSKCASNSENEVMFDIVRSPGRVISVCYGCDLRIDSQDEVIGFTKTGKVFVAHITRSMISLLDRTSKRTLVTFKVEDGEESESHIQSYVPSETSPLPPTEMPSSSSSQGTWATSYEDDPVEDEVIIDEDDLVEDEVIIDEDDPVEDVVILD